MRKMRMEKGITLVALIIVVVMIILVLIWSASNTTIEQTTVSKVKNKVLSITSNTDVYDKYGNKIVVPAGFKIVVDDSTNNAEDVTKGIVIEDCTETTTKGSQFVWVPVGNIKTGKSTKTITLGRYSYFYPTSGQSKGKTEYIPDQAATNYTKSIDVSNFGSVIKYTEDVFSEKENAVAKDLGAFIQSATNNGGYYLGRYEAGDAISTANNVERRYLASVTNTMVCKENQSVYNYVTQLQAANLSQEMYEKNNNFSSDLINSYAWDTAIIFIQTFGNNYAYGMKSGKSVLSTIEPQVTGTNKLNETGKVDEQLNIYDMCGNCQEWSTETGSDLYGEKVTTTRGGSYEVSGLYAGSRIGRDITISDIRFSFRPILYIV